MLGKARGLQGVYIKVGVWVHISRSSPASKAASRPVWVLQQGDGKGDVWSPASVQNKWFTIESLQFYEDGTDLL